MAETRLENRAQIIQHLLTNDGLLIPLATVEAVLRKNELLDDEIRVELDKQVIERMYPQ